MAELTKRAERLKQIVNDCAEAANQSCMGPMFMCPDKLDLSKRVVNQIAFSAFAALLTGVLRGEFNALVDKED
jgi:hypothetical protein